MVGRKLFHSAPRRPSASLVEHDTEHWLRRFRRASQQANSWELRELRKEIIHQTLQAASQRRYRSHDGSVVDLPVEPPVVSQRFPVVSTPRPPPAPLPAIAVHDADCLEEAFRLRQAGFNPVVMNMASASSPGGGYMSGAGAQEENLFRRSDYASHLSPSNYPIHNQVVYTANVKVFRSSEATGYALLPCPYPMAFIAVAAEHKPRLLRTAGRPPRLNEASTAALTRKLQTFCAAAATSGHDALVLSALGCGAFCNPPDHVAEIFAAVLAEYGSQFRRVVFAIFDDHNAHRDHNPEGNLLPFLRRFHQPVGPPPPLPVLPPDNTSSQRAVPTAHEADRHATTPTYAPLYPSLDA